MFTPVKTLPQGTIFYTDLVGVSLFAAWLDAFEVLLQSHPRLATVCAPMRLQKEEKILTVMFLKKQAESVKRI